MLVHSFFISITKNAGGPRRATEIRRTTPSGTAERMPGLAIEVRRRTGPGLLEPFYSAALCREPGRAGIRVRRFAG